jgi:hypothetical protein
MTGKPFRLVFEEISNLVVSSRTISWWFETGPVNSSSGSLDHTILVPISARTLQYTYVITDTYGVRSEIYGERTVLDVIPPMIGVTADAPANGEAISVHWSVSDNIAVKESMLRYRFDGSNWTDVISLDQRAVIIVPLEASVMDLEGLIKDDSLIENVSSLSLDVLDPIAPVVSMFEVRYDPKNDTVRLRARFQDNRGPGTAIVNWSKGGVDQGELDLTNAWYGEMTTTLLLEGFRGEVSFRVVLVDRSGNRVEPQPYSVAAFEKTHPKRDMGSFYVIMALVFTIAVVMLALSYLWLKGRRGSPGEE